MGDYPRRKETSTRIWKAAGFTLATCLVFTTAARQVEVKDDTASKSPGVAVNGNNDQNVTATGGASNKADGKDSEQNTGSSNGSSSSKDSKSGSSVNATSTGDAPAEGGTAVGGDDWKEVAAGKSTVVATIVDGNAVASNLGGTAHVKEDVDQITTTGLDVKTIVRTAEKISIQGSSVKVFVGQVSFVGFNGSGNKVEWANGSKPAVNDNGSDNEVKKTG